MNLESKFTILRGRGNVNDYNSMNNKWSVCVHNEIDFSILFMGVWIKKEKKKISTW